MKRVFAIAAMAVLATSCMFVRAGKDDGTRHLFKAGTIRVDESDRRDTTAVLPVFKSVCTDIHADVTYVQSEGECRFTASGPRKVIEVLAINVDENGRLTIALEAGRFSPIYRHLDIVLYSPSLESVNILGSGDFDSASIDIDGDFIAAVDGSGDVDIRNLRCRNANLSVYGAGDIQVNTHCDSLTASVLGAGDMKMSGAAAMADLTILGAGDIDIAALDAQDVRTDVQGAGSIKRR